MVRTAAKGSDEAIMNFDPEEYARNLEDEYANLDLDFVEDLDLDFSDFMEESTLELANMKGTRLIYWDPRKHPRDLLGRFRRVIDGLDIGETLEIPPASLEERDRVVSSTKMFKVERTGDGDSTVHVPKTFITKTEDGAAVWRSDELDSSTYDLDVESLPIDEAVDKVLSEQGYDRDMVDVVSQDSDLNPTDRAAAAVEYNERVKNGTPSIRMPFGAFREFIKDGVFRTQHETGTSQGMLNPTYRREVELALWPDMDEPPVYGYLSEAEPSADEAIVAPQYGPMRLVLRDDIKERSTTTLGDSLDNLRVPIANGEADEFAMALVYDGMNDETRDRADKSLRNHLLLELQIFGGVTLDDVESVAVDAAFVEWIESDRPLPWGPTLDEQTEFSRVRKFLAEKGIKLTVEPYPDDVFEFEEWLYSERNEFADRWADDNGFSVEVLNDMFLEWEIGRRR